MFIRAFGTHFELNGRRFAVNGANCYYASYASDRMVQAVFDLIQAARFNVLRTWAFLDVESAAPGAWFQCGAGQFNDSSTGLELLDRTIEMADQRDIRLILPLVNHWADFGGMDMYVRWLGLSAREQFYTEGRAREAYRRWVEHVLLHVNTRTGRQYRDEPAILAWELANEPRCEAVGGCEILAAWADEMSAYVKSLDGNHLVGVGDEGFFRRAGAGKHRLYNGSHGADCEALMGVPGIDFGVCHLYPDYEAKVWPAEFGSRWIREHIQAGGRANKPMLVEEYGVRLRPDGIQGPVDRNRIFDEWWRAIDEEAGAGALAWMLAAEDETGHPYPDYDGYTIYQADDLPSVVGRTLRKENVD